MPDKRIDDEFVNQGWEQMQAALDREMPEEKRRRLVPVFWMWAAAASVLLLLCAGLGWWQWQNQPTQESVVAVNKADRATIAEEECDEITKGMNSPMVVENSQTKDNQGKAMRDRNVAILDAKTSLTTVSPTPLLQKRTTKQLAEKLDHRLTRLEVPILESTNTAISEVLPQDFEITNPTILESEKSDNQSVTPLYSIAIAAIKTQSNIALPEPKVKLELWDEEESSDKKQIVPSNFKIGLEFATYTSTNAALDGYAGGAVVDVPIQSKRLNLRAGVNFNAQQRYFDSDPSSGALSADNSGFAPKQMKVNPDPDLSVNAQQLSFPVTLQYKPRRSWGLEGGLQASYLLNAQNLKGAEAYQTSVGVANGSSKVNTFLSEIYNNIGNATGTNVFTRDAGNSKLDINQLNRFDIAVSAGFGYYPTQNIGVRLQYQRGLIDLLKSDDFKAFGNNIRLSAVYFFGKK